MSRLPMVLAGLALMAFALGLGGCGNSTDSATSPEQPGEGAAKDHGHEHDEHGEHPHAETEIEAALAQLSDADRAAAEKQKVCPVSGEPLGSMGKPVKVTVKGREVFLCCQGCEGEIKADPDTYLAKLAE